MELEPKEALEQAVPVGAPGLMISGTGVRGGKLPPQKLAGKTLLPYVGKRARKGKAIEPRLKDVKLEPVKAPE